MAIASPSGALARTLLVLLISAGSPLALCACGGGGGGGAGTDFGVTLPVDTDSDGVPDDTDNCVAPSNAGQADADGDGSGDACDGDSDGDTVPDATDSCAAQPNEPQTDTDTDGSGDDWGLFDAAGAGTVFSQLGGVEGACFDAVGSYGGGLIASRPATGGYLGDDRFQPGPIGCHARLTRKESPVASGYAREPIFAALSGRKRLTIGPCLNILEDVLSWGSCAQHHRYRLWRGKKTNRP